MVSQGANGQHECDLFLMSSSRPYLVDNALPAFARLGSRNIHGWGLGFYAEDGAAHRLPCAEPALSAAGNLSREFAAAVEAARSAVVLGHLRLASAGRSRNPANNHPFLLNFLGYDWLFVHNGTARRRDLVPLDEQLLRDADSDSPRVFEYLRAAIIRYVSADPKRSLLEACRAAYKRLLRDDPGGKYNIILSNGNVTFAFIHWRSFFLLRREKGAGRALLLTTIEGLTREEEWVRFERRRGKAATMLVLNGPTLLLNGDVPK